MWQGVQSFKLLPVETAKLIARQHEQQSPGYPVPAIYMTAIRKPDRKDTGKKAQTEDQPLIVKTDE